MNRSTGRIIVFLMGIFWLTGTLVSGLACADTETVSDVGGTGESSWKHVDFVGRFSFEGGVLENKDLSGIACVSKTRGLIGADESGAVQAIELSRQARTMKVLQTITLANAAEEVDIEAIAAEGDFYYIVGSHGVAKKTGARQVSRYKIFRLRVDRVTGLSAGGGSALSVASLSGLLKDDATLRWYFGKPLQQKGMNIEGLAVRKGQLFVGLRNPNLGGYAFVLELPAKALFDGVRPPVHKLHRLNLGAGLGIREIVAAQSGFLIIAGNAGSEPSNVFRTASDYEKGRGYWFFGWDGKGSAVNKIGAIPNAPGKAEAMTILEESPEEATVLILFDGPKKGKPSVYRLH